VGSLPHTPSHATHGATFLVFCEVMFWIWIVLALKPSASPDDDHCWPGVAKPRRRCRPAGLRGYWRKRAQSLPQHPPDHDCSMASHGYTGRLWCARRGPRSRQPQKKCATSFAPPTTMTAIMSAQYASRMTPAPCLFLRSAVGFHLSPVRAHGDDGNWTLARQPLLSWWPVHDNSHGHEPN
jgi:hypothetical protein